MSFSARRLLAAGSLVAAAVLLAGCTGSTSGSAGTSTSASSTGSSAAAATSAQVTISGGSLSSSPAVGSTAEISPDAVSSAPASSAPATSSVTSSSTTTTTTTSAPAAPLAAVSASPKLGTTDISPAQPISIKVAHGTIQSLTLTNPTGKKVQGTLSADKTTWTLGEVLGYGKTYTAAGTAMGSDGKKVDIKGTYATLSSDVEADSNITPGDGDTVGVAQSVIIRFPAEPTDKALIEKNLSVTTTPKVEGSWAWIHHDDAWGVDWRPKGYWPANTKVHVAANLYGLKIADGMYGSEDLTTDFTIGRSQVVYADAKSFNIVVKQGCSTTPGDEASCAKTVATYDASYGSGDDINDPNRVTRSGIHVVIEKLPVHTMSNPAYGYTHSVEYWDVRISDNGEFIHENPHTVGEQGSVNVSHGCINLSPTSAKEYFNSALIGDPVEVTGTSVKLSASDGDLFDYTIPWSEWKSLSALH